MVIQSISLKHLFLYFWLQQFIYLNKFIYYKYMRKHFTMYIARDKIWIRLYIILIKWERFIFLFVKEKILIFGHFKIKNIIFYSNYYGVMFVSNSEQGSID